MININDHQQMKFFYDSNQNLYSAFFLSFFMQNYNNKKLDQTNLK